MPRQKRSKKADRPVIRRELIEVLRREMLAANEPDVPEVIRLADDNDPFKTWFRNRCERELWFFSRWCLGHDYLSKGTFHRLEVAPFLTDFKTHRSKLLLLPMDHLKSTLASRSMPLHVLIQAAKTNLYVPGTRGCNLRVLLCNENETKSMENLAVSRQHLEENELLRWCWPHIVWENIKDAPVWTNSKVQVPRNMIRAEPSILAIGVKSQFVGRHIDVVIADDICALEASQNPPIMERVKLFRKVSITRLDPSHGIYIGVGTRWPAPQDLYGEWIRSPGVDSMVRSAIEEDEQGRSRALWPEWYPLDKLEKRRKELEPQQWACWYQNQSYAQGFANLDWRQIREYEFGSDPVLQGDVLMYAESDLDNEIRHRQKMAADNIGFKLGPPWAPFAQPRTKAAPGMDNGYFQHMRWKYDKDPATGQELPEQRNSDEAFFGHK